MKSTVAVILLSLSCVSTSAQRTGELLDVNGAWLLVMSIPEVMQVECRGGCPELEFHPVGRDRMWVTARNNCPRTGNGSLGTFTVDLKNGRVWSGVDPVKVIETERLRRLRSILLSRNAKKQ